MQQEIHKDSPPPRAPSPPRHPEGPADDRTTRPTALAQEWYVLGGARVPPSSQPGPLRWIRPDRRVADSVGVARGGAARDRRTLLRLAVHRGRGRGGDLRPPEDRRAQSLPGDRFGVRGADPV